MEKRKTYLILSFKYQDIGYTSEGDAQMDDLCLCHLIRDVANVDHLRWFSVLIFVQLHLQQAPEEIIQNCRCSHYRDTTILNLRDTLMTPIFLMKLHVYLYVTKSK